MPIPEGNGVSIGDNVFEVDPKTGNIRRRYELTAKDKEDDLPNHPGEGWNRCEDPKFATDWTLDHNPIMPLDPNKFIMPVLPYGPNNQLRGFRETIILAIKLNRTVVMPPFYKHRSDPSPGEIRLVFSKFFIVKIGVMDFAFLLKTVKVTLGEKLTKMNYGSL